MGLCPGGSLFRGSLSGGLSRGVSVQGSLSLSRGYLSLSRGSLSGGSLSRGDPHPTGMHSNCITLSYYSSPKHNESASQPRKVK